MFLTLLKRAVKVALHDAVEAWALESGLPRTVVDEMRSRRLAVAAQSEATADARAALALGVEADAEDRPCLPMPSAARVTPADAAAGCPAPGEDEAALMDWVHRQREGQVGWADIARAAGETGHDVREDALRMRYRRWKDKHHPGAGDPVPTA